MAAEQPDEWLPRYRPMFCTTKKSAVSFCETRDVEIEFGVPVVEIRPCYLPRPLPKKR